ncbi:MAG: hypothetical protein M3014_00705, partial [Chloroflexota bacterium]|nr:hypothetical protein [Chloroflexota bacterium]
SGPRDTPQAVRSIVQHQHYGWTLVHDQTARDADHYNVSSFPTVFLINRDGTVYSSRTDGVSGAAIELLRRDLKDIK